MCKLEDWLLSLISRSTNTNTLGFTGHQILRFWVGCRPDLRTQSISIGWPRNEFKLLQHRIFKKVIVLFVKKNQTRAFLYILKYRNVWWEHFILFCHIIFILSVATATKDCFLKLKSLSFVLKLTENSKKRKVLTVLPPGASFRNVVGR